MLGFNCFALAQFWRNIFKHGYLSFTESRPPEKITESSSAHHKPERTASKIFYVPTSLFLKQKKKLGVNEKSHANIGKGRFGLCIEGGKN